jgi:ubiquitin C-terminal hydrolase
MQKKRLKAAEMVEVTCGDATKLLTCAPRGIRNVRTEGNSMGNWCYLIALLQCTRAIPNFIRMFAAAEVGAVLSQEQEHAAMFSELNNVIGQIMPHQFVDDTRPMSTSPAIDIPVQLVAHLKAEWSHLYDTLQHDVVEALGELVNLAAKYTILVGGQEVLPTASTEVRLVRCHQCNTVSERFLPARVSTFHLALLQHEHGRTHPRHHYSLQQLWDAHFAAEQLVTINCQAPSCSGAEAATSLYLADLPTVLLVSIKRFKSHGRKANDVISVSPFLRVVSPRCSTTTYELVAQVHHRGVTLANGHYVAYVRHAGGQWFCCNDAEVTPVSHPPTTSTEVYMLAFIRCDVVSNSCNISGRSSTSSGPSYK